MSYQEVLENLGETTSREVLARLRDYEQGRITAEQFTAMAVTVIALANEQGRIAAELSYSAWLQAAGYEPIPAAAEPIGHYRNTDRLTKAVETVRTGPAETVETRLDRLARSESVESSQRSFGHAMKKDGRAAGWQRGLDAKPCGLCREWHLGGKVWPISVGMPTHKGCTCNQVPVEKTDSGVRNTQPR